MKYEKEATTKNGRRTWKLTYELVRGPEPKRRADKPATATERQASAKIEATKNRPAKSQPKEDTADKGQAKKGRAGKDKAQLGLF